MSFALIDAKKADVPVETACAVLGVSASADLGKAARSARVAILRPHRVAAGRHRCHGHSIASPSVPLIMVASAINTPPAALPASRTVGPKAKSP
jgi:hypothetical protein